MCELVFTMVDEYGDGWNNGYIEIVGTLSDMVYKAELKQGGYTDDPGILVLPLCEDLYTFTWVKGEWDTEVGFTVTLEGEEILNVGMGSINETFELTLLENYDVDCAAVVNEMPIENNISIMPNPAQNYFVVEGDNIANVEILNALGQVVDVINVENGSIQISTANYNNGIYFVKAITNNAQVIVNKVVVSK